MEAKLELLIAKTGEQDNKIRALLQQKNKQGAALALQRRKIYEAEINRQ